MATVVDRREIRRRRILENSQDRLNKILNIQCGKSKESSESTETLTEKGSSQNLKSDKAFLLHSFGPNEEETNKNFNSNSNYNELLTTTYIYDKSVDQTIGSDFTNYENTLRNHRLEQQTKLQQKSQLIYLHHGFIIFLAFLVRYLCLISEQYAYLITIDTFETYLNKIFVPILIYETVTSVYFREVQTDKSFLTVLILLGTTQNPNLQKLMTCIYHFQCIFQDIMLYFFSFVIFDIGINCLTQGGNYMM